MNCAICDRHPGFSIVHCQKCKHVVCGGLCSDIQDMVCKKEHVHDEDGWCELCESGESGCEPCYTVTERPVLVHEACDRPMERCLCPGA